VTSSLAHIAQQAMPSALEAEQALLGIVLYENSALSRLPEPVTPESFGAPLHARLWDVATGLIGRGRLAEPTALHTRMGDDPDLMASGGLTYLLSLVEKAPPLTTIAEYAARVNEAARRREIIRIAGEAMQNARDPEQEPFSVLTATEAALSALTVSAAPDGHTLVDARAAATEAVDEMDRQAETGVSPGILVGIDCIDHGLGGLFPNELIILAGRPSMGKSGLARAIAMAGARRHPGLLFPFFCLEMDRRQMSRRNLSALSFQHGSAIPYRAMRGRDLTSEQRAELAEMRSRVPTNLLLDETSLLSLEHVRRRLLALSKRGRIGLAVIDYLQIMDLSGQLRMGVNLTTAIGMVTSGLKQLAKQLGIPIILLSQLSRKCEERDNKRPMLGDLRDSGSIEQDASSVLFAYRDAYYLQREGPRRGVTREDHELAIQGAYRTMEVICAKSREGPIGTTKQRYFAECDVVENEGPAHG
jgi:replicative DNA helicase